MTIVDDIVHRIGEVARKDARAMLIPALLALAGGVTGVAALGFLVAWIGAPVPWPRCARAQEDVATWPG